MVSKQRHEYELKFKLGDDLEVLQAARTRLKEAGFIPGQRSIETDYLPDTPNDDCKNAKILLRFREVEEASSHVLLLTLKIKQADGNVLHFREYEVDLGNHGEQQVIMTINDLLREHTGLILNSAVLHAKTLEQVKDAITAIGFSKHRILLSKYRENFSKGKDNATIDFFPDGMGIYTELESHSIDALHANVKSIGFQEHDGIVTDYGDLLKLHKHNERDQAQRTALFSKAKHTELRKIIMENTI